MAHTPFIYIHDITDVLECEEADAYGQEDGIGNGVVGGGDGVEDVGEEIGVFEIAEHAQVDGHSQHHEGFAPPLSGTPGCCLPVGEVVETKAEEVAHYGGEDEQGHIVARGLVVEEEADKE